MPKNPACRTASRRSGLMAGQLHGTLTGAGTRSLLQRSAGNRSERPSGCRGWMRVSVRLPGQRQHRATSLGEKHQIRACRCGITRVQSSAFGKTRKAIMETTTTGVVLKSKQGQAVPASFTEKVYLPRPRAHDGTADSAGRVSQLYAGIPSHEPERRSLYIATGQAKLAGGPACRARFAMFH